MSRPARYAGVLAFHAGSVVLVREAHPTWGGEFWNLPSGEVEAHETPAEGGARELAEETGLVVAPDELLLVSTTLTTTSTHQSRAWNHVVSVPDPGLRVGDPDGLVREARWFPVPEAADVLSLLPYRPLAEPAVAYLRGDREPGRHWRYDL